MKEELYKKQNSEPSNPPASDFIQSVHGLEAMRGYISSVSKKMTEDNLIPTAELILDHIDQDIKAIKDDYKNDYNPDDDYESKIDREPTDWVRWVL